MSMHTLTVTGYGIDGDVLNKVKIENLREFVQKYYTDVPDLAECFTSDDFDNNEESLEGFMEGLDFFEDENGNMGVGALIAAVMNAQNNIELCYYCDSDGKKGIVLDTLLPWEYSEAEASLSPGLLMEIFKKTFAELGVEISVHDLDKQEFTFFG